MTGTGTGTGLPDCPGGGDTETEIVYIDASHVIDTGIYAGIPGIEFESLTISDCCQVCVQQACCNPVTMATTLHYRLSSGDTGTLVKTPDGVGGYFWNNPVSPLPPINCSATPNIATMNCGTDVDGHPVGWRLNPAATTPGPNASSLIAVSCSPFLLVGSGPSTECGGFYGFCIAENLSDCPGTGTGTGSGTSHPLHDFYCAPDPMRASQVLKCIDVGVDGAPPLNWRSGPWYGDATCGDCPGGTIFCVQWTAYNDDNKVIPTPPIQTCMSVDPGSYHVGDTFPSWGGSGAPPPYAPPLPPGYATATASCTISGPPGGVNFIGVISGGAGYTSAPSVRFIDTIGGSGAAAHAVLGAVGGPAEGTVIAVLIDNPGSGYDNPPLVVIGPPTGPDVMFDHWGATFLDGPFPDDGGCEAACGGCSGTLTGTSSCDCDPADPDCLRTVWFCVPPPLGGSPTAPHITPVYSNDPTQGFCVEAQVYSDGPLPNFGGPFATLADCVASPCPQPSGGGLMLSPVKTTTLRQPQPRPRPVEGKRLSLAQLDRGEGTPCKHRGADTGETDWCAGCQATRREVPLYNCTLHNDVCTGWTPTARGDLCCRTCQDRSP